MPKTEHPVCFGNASSSLRLLVLSPIVLFLIFSVSTDSSIPVTMYRWALNSESAGSLVPHFCLPEPHNQSLVGSLTPKPSPLPRLYVLWNSLHDMNAGEISRTARKDMFKSVGITDGRGTDAGMAMEQHLDAKSRNSWEEDKI